MIRDITFEQLHAHFAVDASQRDALSNLMLKGKTFPPVAVYAHPWGEHPLYLSESGVALRESEGRSADLVNVSPDHNYYQIYYELPDGLGDLAVELREGEQYAHISAWDKKHERGIDLGNVEMNAEIPLLDRVSERLNNTMQFMVLLNQATQGIQR